MNFQNNNQMMKNLSNTIRQSH